ncbi:hypothetical protein [Streptomyces sp. NBC_00239]|uniref:hypothetical protein n=1 Tax=Streptomyces sp. NBC_00239 TaxID=2903640 RepID=UPI002E29D7EF|nr:hypothetical protein [Streptomyces sp. NBC_00239]
MSRRMVGDNQDVFRVLLVLRRQERNPAYEPGSGERYYRYTDETFETSYGPYNTIGAARGQLTRETWDHYEGRLRDSVVSGRVQKATTTWEDVS